MKQLVFFLLLSLSLTALSAQKKSLGIAELNNQKEVNELVNSFDNYYLKRFEVKRINDFKEPIVGLMFLSHFKKNAKIDLLQVEDSLGIKSYEIADFDQNGYEDLLVRGSVKGFSGYDTFLILDLGKKKFNKLRLENQEDRFVKVGYIDDVPVLEYYYYTYRNELTSWKDLRESHLLKKDTLIFKNDQIVEYKNKPILKPIEKIIYETKTRYQKESMFQIHIESDRKAIFKEIKFKRKKGDSDKKFDEIEKIRKTKIKKKDFKELMDFISYLDLEKGKYKVKSHSTADKGRKLHIQYKDGSTIDLYDHGESQNFTSKLLYDFIQSFAENQDWIRVSKMIVKK